MAQYSVTHQCGHIATHQLYGKGSERDRRIAYLETTVCSACYRNQRNQEPSAVHLRPVTGGVELVVTNSYATKDTLKGRGYRFGQYHLGNNIGVDNVTGRVMGEVSGWAIRFRLPDHQSAAEMELSWIASQGWPIQQHGQVEGLLASPLEGRPELAGIGPAIRSTDEDYNA